MSEATIKHLATELAGWHYDLVRSSERNLTKRWPGGMMQQIDPKIFVKTYPTIKDFLKGRMHGRKIERYGKVSWVDTGEITMGPPAYLMFYEAARLMLVDMLGRPDTPEYRKKQLYDAIVEDREKQLKQERMRIKSPAIPQRKAIGG